MSLAPGTRLGAYEIVSRIGAGGMGEVYRARDSRLDRDVAVKVLSDAVVGDPDALARFEREAKSVAALSHPNILAIHDVGSAGGVSFAVMELLEGESLADTVAHAKLPWRKAASIGIEIAEGLFAAHSKGIVHRDLKPANVFVTSDGRVKILDFGIARVGSPPSAGGTSVATVAETSPGTVLGTVGYMSPEQVRGSPADARSDVFSLGCVLYEMVTGRRAFARDTAAETLTAILREDPEPVSATEGAVPLELDRIVAHCLEKNPAERFQSARDVAFNLRAALSSSGATESSGRAPRRVRRTGVWVGAGVGLLVLIVGALVLLQRRGARPGAPGDAATAAAPRIASLAVLPLQNLSGDPEQDYFADGMTEALIADLAKIQALRVISRTSVMQYKGVKKPLPEIAKELGVDGIVEGSVQRAGDRVRITAQLIEAATDRHLWAQSYERDSRDVFALQSDVAQAIAREIRVTVSPEEKTRLASSRPVNPAAHEAYLKGRYWQLKFNEEGFRKASELYDRAVALDPGYALAWAGIAENLGGNADLYLPSSEAYAKARPAAEKALQLDDSLAEAHTSLGLIKAYFDWDWRGAEVDLVRAIELNPGSAWARDWYGWFLATLGRFDESISQLERARALDPLSPGMSADLGLAHILKGDYDRAAVHLDRALALAPDYWAPKLMKTWMYQRKGDFAAAVREAEGLDPRDAGPVALAGLARAYALAGREVEARKAFRELEQLSRTGFVAPFFFAEVHAALGEKDVAFEWLRKCQRERSNGLALWAKVGPQLDPLRSDPRYEQLLKDLNLAP
ncbi:MAG TPA: protein kinase [Thermoanaerobaculia bacterium]|nr:protein kinase [Thermoanaerobaculia bacterium]